MENNTQALVDQYNKLGQKLGPDGEPILSVVQTVTTNTYLQARVFDATTGLEQGPIMTEINLPALDTSLTDLANDTDAVNAIKDLVAQVNPSTPVKIKKPPVAVPAQPLVP